MSVVEEAPGHAWLHRERVGNGLTTAGLLGLFVLCMLLPLVGPSGSAVAWHGANFRTFLVVLLCALACSVLGLVSKLGRRRVDGSPLPLVSLGLVALLTVMLVCLMTGLFAI